MDKGTPMTSEDKSVMLTILIGLGILCGSIGSCTTLQNYQDDNAVVEMVKHGADPLEARCAIHDSQGCQIRAAKK